MNLTARQKQILDYIQRYLTRHGIAPTVMEIRNFFNLSSLSTVHKHLKALEKRGCIKRSKGQARAIHICRNESGVYQEIPMLGYIAAGEPIQAFDIPETLSIPDDMLGRGDTFSLQVNGDSMIEDGIHDGDFLIVESRNQAKDGEIVVALVNGDDATVKRYYREGLNIRLQPSNRMMEPIYVSGDALVIRGVVIGLMRKYR